MRNPFRRKRGGVDVRTWSQARQGDVFLERADSLPAGVKPVAWDNGRLVIAYGEVTGHAHAILDANAEMFLGERGEQWVVVHPVEPRERTLRVRAGYQPPGEVVERRAVEDWKGMEWITVRMAGAALEHEEHGAVVLEPGTHVRRTPQREYEPEADRWVTD